MKSIYLDCASGISGNMFLGACIQLGVPKNYLTKELEKLNLSGEYHLEISDVSKNGIGAAYVDVKLLKDFEPEKIQSSRPNIRRLHRHEHNQNHHHRTMADIKKIIDSSDLNNFVKLNFNLDNKNNFNLNILRLYHFTFNLIFLLYINKYF